MKNKALYERNKALVQAVFALIDKEVNNPPFEIVSKINIDKNGVLFLQLPIGFLFLQFYIILRIKSKNWLNFNSAIREIESINGISSEVKKQSHGLLAESILRTLNEKALTSYDQVLCWPSFSC